jgi:hypothetical protein
VKIGDLAAGRGSLQNPKPPGPLAGVFEEWLTVRRTTHRAADQDENRWNNHLGPRRMGDDVMAYEVDFNNVSTTGMESSPVAGALAGLRANEARYFKNKYGHVYAVEPASTAQGTVDWVHRILKGGARPGHRVPSPRDDGVSGREHPHRVRVLRERPVDQCHVHDR